MLIKQPDDYSEVLAELERKSKSSNRQTAKRAADELRILRAGHKGEKESSYHINYYFAPSKLWAVIHDLRLEHAGRVTQIDHLVMNRAMEIYVLETKHFHAGLKITDQGEFLRWNNFKRTFEGMPSPLEQNERHIAVLKDVLKTLDLPVRAGVRLMPNFQTFVLVSPGSRIDRPRHFDTSRVIKADTIKSAIFDSIQESSIAASIMSMAKFVSAETVKNLAEQLASRHRPVTRLQPATGDARTSKVNRFGSARAPATAKREASPDGPTEVSDSGEREVGPSCKACHATNGSIQYGKYGYYFKCAACDVNTAIRFSCKPGHKAKLRKQRERFYRECADCGTSKLYFTNTVS